MSINGKLLRKLREQERAEPPSDWLAEVATRVRWHDSADLTCFRRRRETEVHIREGEYLRDCLRGFANSIEQKLVYAREHLTEQSKGPRARGRKARA